MWLRSSVGRASHRYRGGHGFESRWSPDFFFRLLLSNCLNWKIYCDDHTSLQPQYKHELFHIYFTWFHCTGRYELNKLTLLPMCGFITQLVEHRTGIARVMGSNPVEALIFFFQASSFQLLKLENLLRWSHFPFISVHLLLLRNKAKFEVFFHYPPSTLCQRNLKLEVS